MSKLLALDQASRITGYAIFDDGKLITWGKITLDDYNFGERLVKLRNKIFQLIKEHEIDEVIYEDIQMQENVDTFKKLAEVFGVLYELFTEIGIKQSCVLASVWKSTLNVKGKQRAEQKKNAQLWVTDTYGIKPTQDECDAICIGAHHVKKSAMSFDWSE